MGSRASLDRLLWLAVTQIQGGKVKLTRKQELQLIDIGLQKLLEDSLKIRKPTKTTTKKSGWSKSQHEKFSKTMARKWSKRKKSHAKTT